MNYFVFVVCGAKEYISELNFSLKFIRHFSKHPVLVLTDSRRNEIPIEHDNVIDVAVPEKWGNHQAHLYLETSLPKYVKPGDDDIYCYLDSDVVAISSAINDIFKEYIPPVRFAPDHCTIDYFSAGVMHCSCREKFALMERQFHFLQSYFPSFDSADSNIASDRDELKRCFYRMKQNPVSLKNRAIPYFIKRYLIRPQHIRISEKFVFDMSKRIWQNSDGDIVDYDYPYFKKVLWERHNIRMKNDIWQNRQGMPLVPESPHCDHLRRHIRKYYALDIPSGWQHWNGGVFLFSKQAADFFDDWHRYTMLEIERGMIKSYDDQGTLAVCAWKHNLQNMELLPKVFNFITDSGDKNIGYDPDFGFTSDGYKTRIDPAFLHVYNEWGNSGWVIWQAVVEIGKKYGIL